MTVISSNNLESVIKNLNLSPEQIEEIIKAHQEDIKSSAVRKREVKGCMVYVDEAISSSPTPTLTSFKLIVSALNFVSPKILESLIDFKTLDVDIEDEDCLILIRRIIKNQPLWAESKRRGSVAKLIEQLRIELEESDIIASSELVHALYPDDNENNQVAKLESSEASDENNNTEGADSKIMRKKIKV